MQIPTRPLYQLSMAVILFLAACAGTQVQTGDTRINDLQKQAVAAYEQGDYPKALPLLEEVQAYLEKNAPPEEQNSLEVMSMLANAYALTSHFAASAELGEKTLYLCEQRPVHVEIIYDVLLTLSVAYTGLGEFDRAIDVLEKLLPVTEKLYAPDPPRYRDIQMLLALTHARHGDNLKAKELYQINLTLFVAYTALGEFDRAIDVLEKLLPLTEKLYAPDAPRYRDIQMLLALTHARHGDNLKAKELYEINLPKMLEARGLAASLSIQSEIAFGSVQATMGDYEAAIKTLTEIQPVCEVLQGVDEPYCMVGRQWLAMIHQRRGETKKARLAREPTPEYLFYAANKEEFERQRQKAARLRQEEDFTGAAAILEKVYETLESEKLLFSEQGMAVMLELVEIYAELDDLQYRLKTRVLTDMGIKVGRRYYGPEDPRTIVFAMTGVYNDNELNDHAAAESLGREWLPYCLAVFGPKHLTTLRFKLYLATALAARGQKDEAETLVREVESVWAGKEDKSSEEDKLFAYELKEYRRACR